MQDWNELRTAATVARLGTISAASEALGVHRVTVTRHIDTLEAALGAKLFQRHARGFTPTDLGLEVLRVADATEGQIGELKRIAQGQRDTATGEVVVTSLDVLAPVVLPWLRIAQEANPELSLRFLASDRTFKLEYGEADIAFRAGPKPDHPDNVVLQVGLLEMGLYATREYIEQHGLPDPDNGWEGHSFVSTSSDAPTLPWSTWLNEKAPAEQIAFRTNSVSALWAAVEAGLGIGFLPQLYAGDLVEVLPPRDGWADPIWAVTHVDLHRSARVQAVIRACRSAA